MTCTGLMLTGRRCEFELDLGAKVIAVVPQPIQRVGGRLTQARDQIVVYFNDDDLDPEHCARPAVLPTDFTNDTADNTDDGPVHRPVSVHLRPGGRSGRVDVSRRRWRSLSTGPGTYRLRIGTDEGVPLPPLEQDVHGRSGFEFRDCTGFGSFVAESVPSFRDRSRSPIRWNSPAPTMIRGTATCRWNRKTSTSATRSTWMERRTPTTDEWVGSETIGFVFRDVYGYDPFGVPLRNLITEEQQQRTREVFQLYGQYIGAQFFEANESALPDLVAVGDAVFQHRDRRHAGDQPHGSHRAGWRDRIGRAGARPGTGAGPHGDHGQCRDVGGYLWGELVPDGDARDWPSLGFGPHV